MMPVFNAGRDNPLVQRLKLQTKTRAVTRHRLEEASKSEGGLLHKKITDKTSPAGSRRGSTSVGGSSSSKERDSSSKERNRYAGSSSKGSSKESSGSWRDRDGGSRGRGGGSRDDGDDRNNRSFSPSSRSKNRRRDDSDVTGDSDDPSGSREDSDRGGDSRSGDSRSGDDDDDESNDDDEPVYPPPRQLWTVLCVEKEGTFYESDDVLISLKHEYREEQGRIAVNVEAKVPLEGIEVEVRKESVIT
jgi:hypothetical protein